MKEKAPIGFPKSRNKSFAIFLVFFHALFFCPLHAAVDIHRLTDDQILRVQNILEKLKSTIQKKEVLGVLPSLSYEELYAPLNLEEKKLIKEIQHLDQKSLVFKFPFLGIKSSPKNLFRIDGQEIEKDGTKKKLSAQYLPDEVYKQYEKMMKAMEKDLGKCLYVDSGYRSPADQIYLFIFYLGKHQYSILETASLNALPGYSEHGNADHQAIDFVNENGVDGDSKPEEFEALPEYQWLGQHAHSYGFVLSYPKNNPSGIAFEPWHWHYESKKLPRPKLRFKFQT